MFQNPGKVCLREFESGKCFASDFLINTGFNLIQYTMHNFLSKFVIKEKIFYFGYLC